MYPPGLYLVSVPIGNLGDISLRALEVLQVMDFIACEDTRTTRKLLSHYKPRAGEISAKLMAYHDYNADKMRPRLLARLQQGARIALVSDAGTPLVSDPGYKLVQDVISLGIPITAVPGATALIPALQLSGLPGDRFAFLGFLPSKSSARRRALEAMKDVPLTLIFYEAPPRLGSCLTDMEEVFGGAREAAVARELTKMFEEIHRGTLAHLTKTYTQNPPPKGEIVIIVGPPEKKPVTQDEVLRSMLEDVLKDQSLKSAVESVAAQTGLSKSRIYALALDIKERDKKSPL